MCLKRVFYNTCCIQGFFIRVKCWKISCVWLLFLLATMWYQFYEDTANYIFSLHLTYGVRPAFLLVFSPLLFMTTVVFNDICYLFIFWKFSLQVISKRLGILSSISQWGCLLCNSANVAHNTNLPKALQLLFVANIQLFSTDC